MSQLLKDLDPRFRPHAILLLAKSVEARIPIVIVETLRTPEQHAINVANGRSWIARSLHCSGLAIDICPFDLFDLHGPDKLAWNADEPVWQVLGKIGESIGLRWGGRWKQKDMGHFEYVEPPAVKTI